MPVVVVDGGNAMLRLVAKVRGDGSTRLEYSWGFGFDVATVFAEHEAASILLALEEDDDRRYRSVAVGPGTPYPEVRWSERSLAELGRYTPKRLGPWSSD